MSRITLILFVAILFSACSVLKKTGNAIDADIGSRGLDEREIIKLNIANNDFNIQKAEVEIVHEGEKKRLLASLKYKKEGIFLLSIRSKTGIEIVRLYLTEDSVMINERIKKKLYLASSAFLQNKLGISISALSIILGDFIRNEEGDSSLLKCKKGISQAESHILNKRIIYSIDCSYKKISSAKISDEKGEENIIFFFNNFRKQDNSIFPGKIEIQDSSKNFVVRIAIDKIEFKDINEINFIKGHGYEKVPLK